MAYNRQNRSGHAQCTLDTAVQPPEHPRALQVALRLEQSGWLPDLVLCSTAKRTMQTLEAMQAAVRQLVGVEVHTSAQAYTYAAMDRMLLPHLRVSVAGWHAAASSPELC